MELQKQERQTGFSPSELIRRINADGTDECPKCLCINEIGIICFNGDDEENKAEQVLLSLLESNSEEDRALAFCWLSSVEKLSQTHSSKLSEFKNNPDNKSLLPIIDSMMLAFKWQTN